MHKKPINDVLAANLAHFMEVKGLKQQAMATKAGVSQTAISNYLNPAQRKPSKSGKVPSATLSQVDVLANALGVHVWQLLREFAPGEREAYDHIEAAFRMLHGGDQPLGNGQLPSLVQAA